jgi:tetratricopeptide (TPR) repeat protein
MIRPMQGDYERAADYERRSYHHYLRSEHREALAARELALAEYEAAGDVTRQGDTHRWLSRLAWFVGDNVRAEREAMHAVRLLEDAPARGPELAMAYSNVAQVRMLAGRAEDAVSWGEQAIALAEELGEQEILAHALNNVGTALLNAGVSAGIGQLERSLAIARAHDMEEHVARAETNLGCGLVVARDYVHADEHLDAGIAYCAAHGLDSWWHYMRGYKARSLLDQGEWAAAADLAEAVLEVPDLVAPSRITPLLVLGLVRARRGRSGVWQALDEALALAAPTGELQRLAPVAAARAEAWWLEGRLEQIEDELHDALSFAVEAEQPWATGELRLWLRRAGQDDPHPLAPVAEPYRLELAGEWRAAADVWTVIGCAYEAALARAESGDEGLRREALGGLQQLGATAAAAMLARSG